VVSATDEPNRGPLTSICREWLLQRESPDYAEAKLLECRSWGCDYCQPKRRLALMGLAASGKPNRFLTLTVNPAYLTSPEDRLKALSRAWRVVVKRLRRRYVNQPIEYLAVVEETKAGEPHLHILLHSPFLPHSLLSAWMAELIKAPIVDIRTVTSQRRVVSYIAKYIAKKPAQFGTSKRYWQSKGYDQSEPYAGEEACQEFEPWYVFNHGRKYLYFWWSAKGFDLVKSTDDRDYAIHHASSKGVLPTWPD